MEASETLAYHTQLFQWIRKAVCDAKPVGLLDDYVKKVIEPWLPGGEQNEEEEDMQPIRIMFSKNQMKH